MNISKIDTNAYSVTASTNTFTIPKINLLSNFITIQNTIVAATQPIQNATTVTVNKTQNPSLQIIQ